jgi:hypothetical protein
MDWQILINIGASIVLGTVSWFVRGNREEQRAARQEQAETARELTALRIKVAQDYVTHAALNDIKNSLLRIENKIDMKADK